jgi:putative inorganic carbon (hco3(-)) transporter
MAVLQNTNWQETLKTHFNLDLSSYRAKIYAVALVLVLAGSWVIGATDKGIWVVAGVIGLVMSVLVMLRPQIGMYILVIFIYTNMSTVLTRTFGLPSLNKILVVLIFVSVIATQIMMRRKPLVFRLTEGAILLYLIVVGGSTLIGTGLTAASFDSIVDTAKDFLLVFVIVQLASEEKAWIRALYLLIICAVMLSALTWYQVVADDYDQNFFGFARTKSDSQEAVSDYIYFFRVSGPIGDPNFYAQSLIMVYPLAFYRMLDKRGKKTGQAFGVFATLMIAGAIVFTYSRATLLVMMAITAFMLLEQRINILKIGIVSVFIFTVALPFLPAGYRERMVTIIDAAGATEGAGDTSSRGRLSEAIVAWRMFKDHPFFGIGYSHYPLLYQSYAVYVGLDWRTEQREAHNLYLEAAAETGILGAMTMGFMFVTIFDALRKAHKKLTELGRHDLVPWVVALQFGLIAYMLNSIFLHGAHIRYLRLSIALAVSSTALVQALIERQTTERKRKALSQFDEAPPKLADSMF